MTSKWEGQFSGFASGARPDDITLVPYPFHSEPQILETAEGSVKKLVDRFLNNIAILPIVV
jgi:hypothetical protein